MEWFEIARMAITTAISVIAAIAAVALWLYRRGHAVGSDKTHLSLTLDAFKRRLDEAGNHMSDRLRGVQGIVGTLELLKRDLEVLRRDHEKMTLEHEKMTELFGVIRERVAAMEPRRRTSDK